MVQKDGEDVVAKGTVLFVGKAPESFPDSLTDLEGDDHFHTLLLQENVSEVKSILSIDIGSRV